MSYDLYLQIDTGAKEPTDVLYIGNYTFNVSGMWREALGYSLADLHGRNAADATPDLRQACQRMASDPEKYRAMNPPNGWGDYEGARDYLVEILDGCLAHPKTTIEVSR